MLLVVGAVDALCGLSNFLLGSAHFFAVLGRGLRGTGLHAAAQAFIYRLPLLLARYAWLAAYCSGSSMPQVAKRIDERRSDSLEECVLGERRARSRQWAAHSDSAVCDSAWRICSAEPCGSRHKPPARSGHEAILIQQNFSQS
jgi:hypothetical protein